MQTGRPVLIAVLVAMPAAAMMAQQPKPADAIVRSPRPVTLEILDAIARAHGELSWSVHYDAGGERFENATISLTGGGLSASAVSASAEREALRMRDRRRIMIPVISPMDHMLMLYVQRART